jgi:hypothetical protein
MKNKNNKTTKYNETKSFIAKTEIVCELVE